MHRRMTHQRVKLAKRTVPARIHLTLGALRLPAGSRHSFTQAPRSMSLGQTDVSEAWRGREGRDGASCGRPAMQEIQSCRTRRMQCAGNGDHDVTVVAIREALPQEHPGAVALRTRPRCGRGAPRERRDPSRGSPQPSLTFLGDANDGAKPALQTHRPLAGQTRSPSHRRDGWSGPDGGGDGPPGNTRIRSHPEAARIERAARRRLGDARFAEATRNGTQTSWSELVAMVVGARR